MRPKKLHRLRHNLTSRIPTQYIFFDTETRVISESEDSEEHSLWFGCARFKRFREDSKLGTRDEIVFYTAEEFWDWLEEKSRTNGKIWLFAHNTAFDFRILKGFSTLPGRGWKMRRPIFDHGKFIVTWRKGTSTLTFSDTMNYFSTSLQQLGKSIGEDKLSMPTGNSDIKVWIAYCWQDVNVIERTILMFRDFLYTEDLGSWGVTAARQAMNAYTHRFMKHKILIHDNEGASCLEIACYHGGRVEAFRLGKLPWDKIYKLDVNSMYPYVMATKQYPRAVMEYIYDLPPREVAQYVERFALLGHCYIATDEPIYPKIIDDKLCFPIGAFDTFLTPGEIEYALQRKHLIRFIEGYFYERAFLFTDYVEYFYGKRREWEQSGNKAFAAFCKLLLNSLYGKFGQRVPKSTIVRETDPDEMSIMDVYDNETGQTWREITIGGLCYREGERELSFNSFPAISATVTGYARVYLWELLQRAGCKEVAYIDTDSLIISERGAARLSSLLDDTRLGALKIEAIADIADIRGLKDYQFGDERHTKGVKPTDPEIAPGVFKTVTVPGIRTGLAHGDAESIHFNRVLKHYTREYDKGIVNDDNTISPFFLDLPIPQ